MIIDCISDLHGFYPELAGGDLLIIAGDITARDDLFEWAQFFKWLKDQQYKKKILIAGNHDNFLINGFPTNQEEAEDLKEVQEFIIGKGEDAPDFEYLCDSGTEFEGLKIWGSPHSLWFRGINPKCRAFTGTEKELKKKFDLIPDDVDILITHTPIYGQFDLINERDTNKPKHCGSGELLKQFYRINPELHVCAHIHEWGGNQMILGDTIYVNASIMDENYNPVNQPIRVIL